MGGPMSSTPNLFSIEDAPSSGFEISDSTPTNTDPSRGLSHITNYSGVPIPSQPRNPYEAIGRGIKESIPTPQSLIQTKEALQGVIKSMITGKYEPVVAQQLGVEPYSPVTGGHIGQFFHGLKQSIYPSEQQFPGYQTLGKGIALAAGGVAGGQEGQNLGRKTVTAQASPEMALTSAMRSTPKVNVTTLAPDVLPALREAAGYLEVGPEHLQGARGVQIGQRLLEHALDVHESRFKQLIGPVQNEIIPKAALEKYPQLAEYVKAGDVPVTVTDIDKARTIKANQFYARGEAARQGASGALLDAKQISNQARNFLYQYIQDRTGVDPGPMKATESALLRLKPIMDKSVAQTLKDEADFQTSPPEARSSNVLRKLVTAARAAKGSPTAALDLLSQTAPKGGPPMSPAEMFNTRMRLALGNVPKGGPPATGAAPLIGGPQELPQAPTQFGGGTNTPFKSNVPLSSLDYENIVRRAPGTEAEQQAIQSSIERAAERARSWRMNKGVAPNAPSPNPQVPEPTGQTVSDPRFANTQAGTVMGAGGDPLTQKAFQMAQQEMGTGWKPGLAERAQQILEELKRRQ